MAISDSESEDSPIDTILKNKNLKKTTGATNFDTNITDEEIYIVKLSKSVNPKTLLNCNLKTKSLNRDGEKLKLIRKKDAQTILISNKTEIDSSVVKVPIKGTIKITKDYELEENELIMPVNHVMEKISLPSGIKQRHPLLGVEFSELDNVQQSKKRKRH